VIGQTISHYKITEKLGEGGMGVVYKAEDTNLKRPVALKFLAAHLLGDEGVKERFRREAEAAAALTHANIAVIHDINESDGHSLIAMEFVEGPTVGEKVGERPLKLAEALDIAIQAAQGLQAAHEKDIVHRDIKSANLMVTPQGQVKIMDFGLAQLAERSKLTETTTILGTPSYMSPEQAVGDKTDRRTDLWSLGVVLYEMVTARLPFEAERQEAVLYGITNEEPEPVTALRAGLPMELEWIIGKALAKDRDERYQHAEDLLVDLRGLQKKLASGSSTILKTGDASQTGGAPSRSANPVETLPSDAVVMKRSSQRALQAMAAVLAVALLGLAYAYLTVPEREKPVRRFTLTTDTAPLSPSISPNGRHVAYLTGSQIDGRLLWVQDLDQNQPRLIAGPADIRPGPQPSWSPDSEFICFRLGNELKKVSVSGGPTATVCEVSGAVFGTSWTPDGGSIIFNMARQLHKVSAGGGKPEPWLAAQQEGFGAYDPAFFSLETGIEKLLYVEATSRSDRQIIALDRSSGQREVLTVGRRPIYDPSGHVIYVTNDPLGLWAIPFSVDTMKATGNPFPIAENLHDSSIATDGTLVYLEEPAGTGLQRLVWRDREGKPLGSIGQPQNEVRYPALSPDGKRVAVRSGRDIWIHEVGRPVRTRLTTDDAYDTQPTWSPTGDRIAFASGRTGDRDIYVKRADGSGEATPLLLTEGTAEYLTDWSKDETILLFYRMLRDGGAGNRDIFYLRRKDDGSYEEFAFQATQFEEVTPKFSPDEQFIAYVSNESGQLEIYIQAFPQGGSKRRVSLNGGFAPRWRADGKELFYVEGTKLMAIPVATSPSLTVGTPEALFSAPGLAFLINNRLGYDVTPEGDKFVIQERVETDTETQHVIRVVENWYEEFRDREQD
jgi:serine/threonine protein kinase